ncbi:MAG: 2-methylthioadenine synthetase, partial [Candidatus Diapherotrites archaeon]|nr:2-methylthioadenine synthetase [Candidatus Diapherotrites archaeon]
MRAYVETHGCTLNQADSVIIKNILQQEGVMLVDDPTKADWIFLNTCAVKNATENRMLSRIRELNKLEGQLVICGCLPKINLDAIKIIGDFSILDTNSLDKIPELLHGKKRVFFSDEHLNKLELPLLNQGTTAAIPISEGCLGSCSFCATLNSRGRLTSDPIKDVRLAVERAVS